MPLCQDRAAKELNEKGYSLVKYPRANIAPLDLIAGERSPLEWLGPINQVWKGKLPVPDAAEALAPNFTVQRSDEFKGSIGVRILQGLVRNIGGNVATSASVSSSMSFTYENPKHLSVSPFLLGEFLKNGDLDSDNAVLKRYLEVENAIDTHFFVITEVLRARKLLVRVSGESSSEVTADAAALQGLANANAAITTRSAQESEVAFDGAVDITFAFRAYELGYVRGKWTVIGATRENLSSGRDANESAALFGDRPVALTFN